MLLTPKQCGKLRLPTATKGKQALGSNSACLYRPWPFWGCGKGTSSMRKPTQDILQRWDQEGIFSLSGFPTTLGQSGSFYCSKLETSSKVGMMMILYSPPQWLTYNDNSYHSALARSLRDQPRPKSTSTISHNVTLHASAPVAHVCLYFLFCTTGVNNLKAMKDNRCY